MTLEQLSFFYHNFSVMLNAGISITDHIETLQNGERDPHRRAQYAYILSQLHKGNSASSLLQKTALVPIYDIPLIEAGEKSGRLVQVFQMLSKYYQLSADTEKEIKRGLYYPLFIFSAALFLPKFAPLVLGEITVWAYLSQIFVIEIIVLGTIVFLFHMHRKSYFDMRTAQMKLSLFSKIPILSSLAYQSALEKFCTSLSMMLESGVSLIDALRMAGQTSPDMKIQLAARRIAGEVKGAMSLPLAFSREPVFTQDIQNSITLGTKSGELPEFLNRSAMVLRDQVARSITMISKVVPQFIYYMAVGYVAWTIISLHLKNFRDLSRMF